MQRTLDIRGTTKQLFLTYGTPHRAASRDSIRRWVKDVMHRSGIDMNIFAPHSVRSSSMNAVTPNVSLATILRTGGWFSHTTFTKYYSMPVTSQFDVQDQILKRHRKNVRK